jgi:hypothetical protein
MIKIKFYFTLDKHLKEIIKIGTDVEDCWSKVEQHFWRAKKPPIMINYEILEQYKLNENKMEQIHLYHTGVYLLGCDILRQNIPIFFPFEK